MLTISSGLLLIMMHLDGSLSLLILVVLHCFNTHYFLFAICQVLEATMEGGSSCSSTSSGSSSSSTRSSSSSDSSNEEVTSMLVDDEDSHFTSGMLLFALHTDKYLSRSEYRVPLVPGIKWVERKLTNRESCYKMFRMTPTLFYRLHEKLESYGLKSTNKCSSIEALGMFLWMVGAPQSVRQAEDRFERSLGTVHNNFMKVLNCLCKLAAHIITPRDPSFSQTHHRLQNPRFSPFFDNCIGAIDGTHVPVIVDKDLTVQHMCRKNITTQNVMACCDFDMRFTFVLVG